MVSITEESTVGRRIVTAAEYDRWKAVNDEIHVDVKCSAEEVIVTLEGALPHTPFHLKDPGCRLEPISRNAQQIQVYKAIYVYISIYVSIKLVQPMISSENTPLENS